VGPVHARRRRWALALIALGLLALALAALPFALRAAGRFLVVADPLEPSDAIVVMDGGRPAREVEAAALYRRGLAPRVVLSLGRDPMPVARRLAGEPPLQEQSARALVHAGVPPDAVVRIRREAENTREELAIVREWAEHAGLRRVILVTSPHHTRRVRLIWDAHHQAHVAALVHPTPYEPFDPTRWWRARRTLEKGLHELFGVLHFLVGSPLPTFER